MRTWNTWLNTVAAACIGVSCLLGVGRVWGAGPTGAPIKVGSLNSMTGLNSTFGQCSDVGFGWRRRNGTMGGGGVLGRPVEIATANTESRGGQDAVRGVEVVGAGQGGGGAGGGGEEPVDRGGPGMSAGEDAAVIAGVNESESDETGDLYFSVLFCG